MTLEQSKGDSADTEVPTSAAMVDQRATKRNLISSIFIAVLIGIGFQETVSPVRESFRASGFTLGTAALLTIFFLTSLRFFIGNQLHLMNERLTTLPGWIWFYDFAVVVLQCGILIFIAGNTSVKENELARLDFITLLILLYVIDILWIGSQWLTGRIRQEWKRPMVPWAWCILNMGLIASLTIIRYFSGDSQYSDIAMVLFLLANVVAFVVDVILIDYYDLI